MFKTKKVILIGIIFVSIFMPVYFVLAHQPRIVKNKLTEVQNAEVSQAFYGELNGTPDFFRIKSDKPFKFYAGVLVPDIKDVGKDVSVEVMKIIDENENKVAVCLLDGKSFEWVKYYEEFGGDNYFKGPEVRKDLEVGIYDLKVFSPDNKGRYTLAIGEKEEFPVKEIINTIFTLPILKKNFFDRSPFTAFFNYTGLFLAGFILIIIIIIYVFYRIIKRVYN
jgi:hypothetical protein